jgi:hypothetical protein
MKILVIYTSYMIMFHVFIDSVQISMSSSVHKLNFIDYYMAFFISHVISSRDTHISPSFPTCVSVFHLINEASSDLICYITTNFHVFSVIHFDSSRRRK